MIQSVGVDCGCAVGVLSLRGAKTCRRVLPNSAMRDVGFYAAGLQGSIMGYRTSYGQQPLSPTSSTRDLRSTK